MIRPSESKRVQEGLAGRPVRPEAGRVLCPCGRAGHRTCRRVADISVEEEAPPTERDPAPWGTTDEQSDVASAEEEIQRSPRPTLALWETAITERALQRRFIEPVNRPAPRPLPTKSPRPKRPPLYEAEGFLFFPEADTPEAFEAELRRLWPIDTSARPLPASPPSVPTEHVSPRKPGAFGFPHGTKTILILDTLRSKPGVSISGLAATVYGSSDRRGNVKIGVLLAQLKNAGRVRQVKRGQWEAT